MRFQIAVLSFVFGLVTFIGIVARAHASGDDTATKGYQIGLENVAVCFKKQDAIEIAKAYKEKGPKAAFDLHQAKIAEHTCVFADEAGGYVGDIVYDGPVTVIEIKGQDQKNVSFYVISKLRWEPGLQT